MIKATTNRRHAFTVNRLGVSSLSTVSFVVFLAEISKQAHAMKSMAVDIERLQTDEDDLVGIYAADIKPDVMDDNVFHDNFISDSTFPPSFIEYASDEQAHEYRADQQSQSGDESLLFKVMVFSGVFSATIALMATQEDNRGVKIDNQAYKASQDNGEDSIDEFARDEGCRLMVEGECAEGQWCRPTEDGMDGGVGECIDFVEVGGYCGGYIPIFYEQVCASDLLCYETCEAIADEPGVCLDPNNVCSTDEDCPDGQACQIVDPFDCLNIEFPWINQEPVGQCVVKVDGCTNNAGCEEDEYCQIDFVGVQDSSFPTDGECVFRPEACTMDYDPVCGMDGVTYSNACVAASNGVNVKHDDECFSCELSDGTGVLHGWEGQGAQDNWCNDCFCVDGVLSCTEMYCTS